MKQNKLKMTKLTEEEKKALAKAYRYETIGDLAMALIILLAVAAIVILIGGLL